MHSGAPRLQPGPRLRAGAVPYLNAKPLTSGLAASTVLDLREEAPSLLAAELAEGRLDLGEAWRSLTGLPFVYALWAGPALDAATGEILRTAAHKGLEDRPGIARREAAALGLDEAETLTYLTRHIRYELGGRQHAGLRTYAGLLRSHGLLESALEPAWV